MEGKDNNAILTVTVDNPNSQPITFNYTTAPINATANVDYTSKTGTITIAPNTATATISIPILNDNLNEADGLSWIWWVKCILRYIPSSEGVERTTKTQRTQRLIDPM